MKPRGLAIAILVVLALLTFWGLLKRHSEEPPAAAPPSQTLAESHPEPNPQPTDNQPTSLSTPFSQGPREQLEAKAKRREVPLNLLTQQALVQMSNMEQEMSASVNRTVSFYGKVVDENELPIKDATIQFGCVVFPKSQILTSVVSDPEGRFYLASLTGAILTVQVNKHGYEVVPGTNQNSFTFYSTLPTGGFNPDPSNPVIFRLRRKAE